MIPLDRVRELLAAMHSTDLQELAREEPDWTDLCAEAGPVDLFIAAPDLARQVLSLTDALATAEASIAQLRADLERADYERQRVESERDAMEEQRDTARSALVGLVAAVRTEREARIAVVERVARCEVVRDSHECVSGMAHDRLHEARALHDKATAHLDALISAAPPRSTVDARVVRAYLRADARSATGTHADATALAAARTALDAALAAATTTPTEGHRP